MKAKIKDHFTKITNQRVYPATSQHANIGKSINRVKTENILFDFVFPDWLKEEWYNMIIHFEERLFMVRSNDFDFVDTKAIAENDPELDKLNMDCGDSNARSKILTNE